MSVTSQIDKRYPYSVNDQETFTVYSLIYDKPASIISYHSCYSTLLTIRRAQPKREEAAVL